MKYYNNISPIPQLLSSILLCSASYFSAVHRLLLYAAMKVPSTTRAGCVHGSISFGTASTFQLAAAIVYYYILDISKADTDPLRYLHAQATSLHFQHMHIKRLDFLNILIITYFEFD